MKSFIANPRLVNINRTRKSMEPEKEEVIIEQSHISTVDIIKRASDKAEEQDLEATQVMLVDAQNSLDDVVDEPNEFTNMLKYEME